MAIKKQNDGTYMVDVSMGADVLGNRTRIRKKGIKTYTEAEQIEADLIKQKKDKKTIKNNLLVKEVYTEYIDDFERKIAENSKKTNTTRTKKSVFENHIIPHLGDIKITKITEEHIEKIHEIWKNEKGTRTKDNQKNATLIKYHKQLSAFLNWCVKKKYITYNPAREIGNFKKEKKEQEYLTIEEFVQLMKSITDVRDKFIITLLFYCGLRIGELLGIKKENFRINENEPFLYIKNTWSNGVVYDETKTESSYDKIYLDEFSINAYQEYHQHYKNFDFYNESDFLFPSSKSKGKILSDTAIRDMIKKYMKESGITKKITPHKFRHSCAALLIAMGMQLEDIKDRLRHSSIKTTSDVYGHMYDTRKKSTANSMSNFVKEKFSL